MRDELLETVQSAVKNWWLSLVLGILFTITGVWMLFYPVISYVAIVWFFKFFMLVSGVLEIAYALSNTHMRGWGWYLTAGIVDIVLALYLFAVPGLGEAVIPFIIAFWLMFRGFSSIGFSTDMNQLGVRGWGWYLVLGILAIICSMLIIWQPLAGAKAAIYMVSFAFIFVGLFRIMLAFGMKNVHKKIKDK